MTELTDTYKAILDKFPTNQWVLAGSRSVPGVAANYLVRQGYLERKKVDPRLGFSAMWQYRRVECS